MLLFLITLLFEMLLKSNIFRTKICNNRGVVSNTMSDSTKFEPLSQTSFFVETYHAGKSISTGTCFFITRNDKTFLITNWHIVKGQNPKTKEYLGYYAVSPDSLVVKIYKNQDILELTDFEVRVTDSTGNKLWLEHPKEKENIDVVAIPVDIPNDKLIFSPETFIEPFNETTSVLVGKDVFILGYPFGINGDNIFPIWKRGSIASEPILNMDGLPKLFVDTATRPGMSGSPVVYIEKRQIGIGDADPGTPGAKFSNRFMQIVGAYSGRIGADDELNAQLGIVWKFDAIIEIVNQ